MKKGTSRKALRPVSVISHSFHAVQISVNTRDFQKSNKHITCGQV